MYTFLNTLNTSVKVPKYTFTSSIYWLSENDCSGCLAVAVSRYRYAFIKSDENHWKLFVEFAENFFTYEYVFFRLFICLFFVIIIHRLKRKNFLIHHFWQVELTKRTKKTVGTKKCMIWVNLLTCFLCFSSFYTLCCSSTAWYLLFVWILKTKEQNGTQAKTHMFRCFYYCSNFGYQRLKCTQWTKPSI